MRNTNKIIKYKISNRIEYKLLTIVNNVSRCPLCTIPCSGVNYHLTWCMYIQLVLAKFVSGSELSTSR